jgi:hypothetical protein
VDSIAELITVKRLGLIAYSCKKRCDGFGELLSQMENKI